MRIFSQRSSRALSEQPPLFRESSAIRLGECSANHATFSAYENIVFPTAYDLRTKSAKSTGSERIGARRAIFRLFRAWPVNRSIPKTPGILSKRGGIRRGESECLVGNGVAMGTGNAKPSGHAGIDRKTGWFRATETPNDTLFAVREISRTDFSTGTRPAATKNFWLIVTVLRVTMSRNSAPPHIASWVRWVIAPGI